MDLLSPEIGLFVWTLLAFLIVFYILGKFAWKPILNSLNERETGIAESIATADRVKKEMAQLKNENEQLMQQAREERTMMLKEAKDTRDKIVNEAKDAAKAEANKIIAEAQQQIHQQKMAALTEVKNEIGKLAVSVAEKVLRKELSSVDAQSNYASILADDINMN
jgi:F-type H+-transporting ATPase subunit b